MNPLPIIMVASLMLILSYSTVAACVQMLKRRTRVYGILLCLIYAVGSSAFFSFLFMCMYSQGAEVAYWDFHGMHLQVAMENGNGLARIPAYVPFLGLAPLAMGVAIGMLLRQKADRLAVRRSDAQRALIA